MNMKKLIGMLIVVVFFFVGGIIFCLPMKYPNRFTKFPAISKLESSYGFMRHHSTLYRDKGLVGAYVTVTVKQKYRVWSLFERTCNPKQIYSVFSDDMSTLMVDDFNRIECCSDSTYAIKVWNVDLYDPTLSDREFNIIIAGLRELLDGMMLEKIKINTDHGVIDGIATFNADVE